jgi:hypothetical protein
MEGKIRERNDKMNNKKDCTEIKKKGRSDRKVQMGLWTLRKELFCPSFLMGHALVVI